MAKAKTINIDLVRGEIMSVWNYIGYDALQMGNMSNAAAIECCIDADRITSFARGPKGKESAKIAEAELNRAIKEHGYDKVLRALAREIKLS